MIKNAALALLITFFIFSIVYIYNLNRGGDYRDGILHMGLNSTAHLMCSCFFVSENDESFCREYAALEQVSPRIEIDIENKSVRSSLLLFFSAEAEYVGENAGCRIRSF